MDDGCDSPRPRRKESCIAKRARTTAAMMKRRSGTIEGGDLSESDHSSGYSSSGSASRLNSANSFRDLLLATLEISDNDTATSASTDRTGLRLTISRLLYKSTSRRRWNGIPPPEIDKDTVTKSAPTYSLYQMILPASQHQVGNKFLCLNVLREDLEKKTTRGQLVNGKREPLRFPPQW